MRLSREMEFNADEVALSICGTDITYQPCGVKMSNACFQQLLQRAVPFGHISAGLSKYL